MRRIFLIHMEPFAVDVIPALRQRSIDPVLIVHRGKNAEALYAAAAPLSLRLTSPEAQFGTVPDSLRTSLQPARVRDLQALSTSFPRVLQMLERSNADGVPSAQLYQRYLRMVGLWRTLLDSMKPDAVVINGDVPHKGFDLILAELCKADGLPLMMFRSTLLDDRLVIAYDVDDVPGPTSEEIVARAKKMHREKKHSTSEHQAESDVERRHRLGADTTQLRQSLSWKAIARGLVGTRQWQRMEATPLIYGEPRPRYAQMRMLQAREKWAGRKLLQAYDLASTTPDLTVPYVYLPMQVQPEAMANAACGYFSDHVHVARILSSALPPGWRLYIKEHPNQFRRGPLMRKNRSVELYEELQSLPSTSLVPLEVPSTHLLQDCRAVATIAGSTGYEALKREKPALVFGTPWYARAPGLFHIKEVEDAQSAMSAIAAGQYVHSTDLLQAYEQLMCEQFTTQHIQTGDGTPNMSMTAEEHARVYSDCVAFFLEKTSEKFATRNDLVS